MNIIDEELFVEFLEQYQTFITDVQYSEGNVSSFLSLKMQCHRSYVNDIPFISTDRLAYLLCDSFEWSSTMEGHAYWESIYNNLKEDTPINIQFTAYDAAKDKERFW